MKFFITFVFLISSFSSTIFSTELDWTIELDKGSDTERRGKFSPQVFRLPDDPFLFDIFELRNTWKCRGMFGMGEVKNNVWGETVILICENKTKGIQVWTDLKCKMEMNTKSLLFDGGDTLYRIKGSMLKSMVKIIDEDLGGWEYFVTVICKEK